MREFLYNYITALACICIEKQNCKKYLAIMMLIKPTLLSTLTTMIFFIFDLQLTTLIIRLQPSTNKIKVSLRYIPLHPFTIALARHNYFINESKNKILLTSIIVDIVDQLLWWFVREKSFHGRIKIYPSYIFYWILEKKIHLFDSLRGTSLFKI